MLGPLAVRHATVDAHDPRRRDQHTSQDLDGGRLAGSIGTDVPNRFATLHAKANRIDRAPNVVLPCDERPDRTEKAPEAPIRAKLPNELFDLDERHAPLLGARLTQIGPEPYPDNLTGLLSEVRRAQASSAPQPAIDSDARPTRTKAAS